MNAHAETVSTVIGCSVGLATLGGIAVRRITKPLRRVGDAYEAFMGSPADPALGRKATPGVMVRLDHIDERLDDVDRGNLDIIETQKRSAEAHRTLAGEVAEVKKKVGQTLTIVGTTT